MRTLYAWEVSGGLVETYMRTALDEVELSEDQQEFAERLTAGVQLNLSQLDGKLKSVIKDYDYSRLAAVDRALLRMGAHELLFEPNIPPAVTINEALELAKKYSTAESARFINGVLGGVLKKSEKANWVAPETVELEESMPEQDVPEVEVEVVDDAEIKRVGAWKIRNEDAV